MLLDEILSDFNFHGSDLQSELRNGRPISTWVPGPYKAKYDLIQKLSGRKYSKILRRLIMMSIDRLIELHGSELEAELSDLEKSKIQFTQPSNLNTISE